MRRVMLLALLTVLLFGTVRPAAAAAESERVFFPQTGFYVANFFLKYYNTYGGLDMFGYPRSNQIMENGRVVQYFQRQRMEWWPQNPQPYEVQLTLIGDVVLGPGDAPVPANQIPSPNDPNRRYYKETGHTIAFAFKDYFDARGGLWMFGYPTSEQYMQDGFIVQRFQRARLQYHPENPPAYRVQLGLLGDTWLKQQGKLASLPVNDTLGVPTTALVQEQMHIWRRETM